MRKLQILFTRPREFKLGSWIISKWINRPYSHVAFSWIDDQNREIVWQAAHGCVHTILMSNFIKENEIVNSVYLDMTNAQYQHLRDFCYYYSGYVYSFTGLFHVVAYDVSKKFGIPIIPENSKGFICSELCSLGLLQVFGYALFKASHLMKPDDIFKLLINEGVVWNNG